MRWVDTYFPFTEPSFELEIYFKVSLLPLREVVCLASNLSIASYLTSFYLVIDSGRLVGSFGLWGDGAKNFEAEWIREQCCLGLWTWIGATCYGFV